jgi:hypothetical protein
VEAAETALLAADSVVGKRYTAVVATRAPSAQSSAE